MSRSIRIGIISDIHYASKAEQARGGDFELACVPNPLLRLFVRFYRHCIWLRDPMQKNYLLDKFLETDSRFDYLVANGDYSCDSAYAGLSDDAAFQSASECVQKLREAYSGRLELTFGDHELGKLSLFGGRGGMRLASWRRAVEQLRMEPVWRREFGRYVLVGVVSSLIALPVFEPDLLAEEKEEWAALRRAHLQEIGTVFNRLSSSERVLLFCHDPTALPFLAREAAVQARLGQIEQTIIGHLHSDLILFKSRCLAGLPRLTFLGHTAQRLSSALREARHWRPFHVRLCPSLAGLELLKDGGYLSVKIDPEAQAPAHFTRHRLPR
jgi:hypothetical protein